MRHQSRQRALAYNSNNNDSDYDDLQKASLAFKRAVVDNPHHQPRTYCHKWCEGNKAMLTCGASYPLLRTMKSM